MNRIEVSSKKQLIWCQDNILIRKYLNSRPVNQGVSSLPREVSDDASLQPAPRLLLSQAPQSLLSRAQEALQCTHLEIFTSSELVLLAVIEAICMQNIARVVVTKKS